MDRPDDRLNRLPRRLVVALATPPAAVVVVFVVVPALVLAGRTVDASAISDTLVSRRVLSVAWFTLWQAALTTVVTLVAGMVPAYVVARRRFRGRGLVRALLVVPFMLPTVVTGAAFLALLPDGARGTWWAVVVAHSYVNLAVVVRVVGSMWETLPHDLTAAARTLGASPVSVARHVVLPLLTPAIVAAGSIVFLFAATSFGIVRLLGDGRHTTIEAEVARRALQYGDVGGAVVLSVAQLLVLGIVTVLAARWQRRAAQVFRGDARPRVAARGLPRTRTRIAVVATTVAIATPLVVLVTSSFRSGGRWTLRSWTTWGTESIRPGVSLGVDPWAAVRASLTAALAATAVAVVVGTLAALAIGALGSAGRWLDSGVMLPLGVSGVTVGLGMVVTFARPPFDWRGQWWLVPVGHALIGLPFVVRIVLTRTRAIHPDQRAAALLLGVSPARAWWETTVRRVIPSIGPAAALAAAVSLGEFGATTLLSRTGSETLPLSIAGLLGRPGDLPRAQGFALASLLMAVTLALVTLAEGRGDARHR